MMLNLAEMFLPNVVTALIITTAIRPAIRPYSTAVTPDWLTKLEAELTNL